MIKNLDINTDMSLPTSTGTSLYAADFNALQSIAADIRGISQDGYGLTTISPTTATSLISVERNNKLLENLSKVYTHITNLTTSTNTVTSTSTSISTSLVKASFYNQLKSMADYCLINRYTVHPQQLLHDSSGNTIYYANTSSTRTLPWGANGTTSITHKVRVVWPTRLSALYYFNLGNYLIWKPNYEDAQLNDLDVEWATWITLINNTPDQLFKYDRSSFVSGSIVSRPYASGTLRINVSAVKTAQENAVDFIITYQNVDAPLLIVTPASWAFQINL